MDSRVTTLLLVCPTNQGYIKSVLRGDGLFQCVVREKVAPSVTQRQVCYSARDAFYCCLVEHEDEQEPCVQLKEVYHHSCLPSWVKYFDKKRVYEEYKKKLEEQGFQPLPTDSVKR